MTVTKIVSLGEKEVEVHISAEDVTAAIESESEIQRPFHVMRGINNCAGFMNGLTEEIISNLSPEQRMVIRQFFEKQLLRFSA